MRDGLVDPRLVWHWGGEIIPLWIKFEPIILLWRRRYEGPPKGMYWEWFEDLYYSQVEARGVDRREFANRMAGRARRRKELGLEPIPTYE